MLLKDKLSSPKNINCKEDNIDETEVAKFDALAHEWRNPNGKFANVLAFNQVRLRYVLEEIQHHFGDRKIRILDVGCGAGLLTQPLAEAGHHVLGIDASHVNVEVASKHGKALPNLRYRQALVETLIEERQHNVEMEYDLVLNTEVVEHVPDPNALLSDCADLVAANGIMVVATLNRTLMSFLVGIIGAEYILRALPIGTHYWPAFVTPEEIKTTLEPKGFCLNQSIGMAFNPFTKNWKFTSSDKVNYLITAHRQS